MRSLKLLDFSYIRMTPPSYLKKIQRLFNNSLILIHRSFLAFVAK
jgi:hypothetical protein